MSLLETYDKNKKKHLLKEVTATGAVGGFVGRSGNYIDDKFAGGFHPDFGELEKTLEKQVENDIIKRMYTDDVTPMTDQDFIDLEWDYQYDENEPIYDKDDFINKSETNMERVGIDIKYDEKPEYAGDNFINKSSTNWEYIN